MDKTQRTYTNIETNELYSLYRNPNTDQIALVKQDNGEILREPFYACGFDSLTIRLNTKKEINLNSGSFYQLKEDEKVTHRKFAGFNKFSKVK